MGICLRVKRECLFVPHGECDMRSCLSSLDGEYAENLKKEEKYEQKFEYLPFGVGVQARAARKNWELEVQ